MLNSFEIRYENVLTDNYTGFVLTESKQFPVSVRTPNYKRLEDRLFIDANPRQAAQELWSKVSQDPNSVGLDKFTTIKNPHGKWFKLKLRIPGQQGDYRLMAFEPSECPGLLIWDWVGTHEDYNKVWPEKIKTLPSGWLNTAGRVREPYLVHACQAATNAREKGFSMPEPQLAKRAAVVARATRARRPGAFKPVAKRKTF